MIDGHDDFVVYMDALGTGFRCVLMKRDKVISNASCQLNMYEHYYPTHDLKLAVVIFTLRS